jgi:hypothetical protein
MIDSVNFSVGPYYEAVKKYVPMLAKKADVVMLLCELPSTALDTMLLKFPEIDIVVSSGALKSGEQPTKVGHAQIVGTGSSGYSGHYAMLELNPAWKDSVGFVNFSDFLTDNYEEKGAWTDRLTAFSTNPPPNPPIPGQKTPTVSATPPATSTSKVVPVPAPGEKSMTAQPPSATPQKSETGH